MQLTTRTTNNGKDYKRSSAQLVLYHYGWGFLKFFGLECFSKVHATECENFTFVFFLLFFLRSSLAGSLELFHYYNLIFLYFQFSAVRPDHLSQAYFQKTVHKIHPTTDHPIGVQIRLTNPNTTPDNQTRPPNKTTIRSDRHGHTRLQDQMSPPDYCP